MDHVAGSLHILLAEKKGEDLVQYDMSQTYHIERIIWWCLCVLEIVIEYFLECALKIVMLEKKIKKLMISHTFHHTHLLEVGLTKIS